MTTDTPLALTEATAMTTVQLGHIWEDVEPRLAAPKPPMATDTIGGHLVRAAELLRGSHPVTPYITVTATLRVSGDAYFADCRPVYAARVDGGNFLPWVGTGGTLDDAVAECLAEMQADPDAGLRAECDRRGYTLTPKPLPTLETA